MHVPVEEYRVDCLSAESNTGAAFYSPEIKRLRLGGVLKVARHKKLRLIFGNCREMARPLL